MLVPLLSVLNESELYATWWGGADFRFRVQHSGFRV
jgi:hypothetical protein